MVLRRRCALVEGPGRDEQVGFGGELGRQPDRHDVDNTARQPKTAVHVEDHAVRAEDRRQIEPLDGREDRRVHQHVGRRPTVEAQDQLRQVPVAATPLHHHVHIAQPSTGDVFEPK